MKSIEFDHRLPPSSIGARRTRPSSKEVMNELKRQRRSKKNKIKEQGDAKKSGNEKEKQAKETVEKPMDHEVPAGIRQDDANNVDSSMKECAEAPIICSSDSGSVSPNKTAESNTSPKYYQLEVNARLIQEEVDEIKGADRAAFNNLPAFLSSPMASVACNKGLLSANDEFVSQAEGSMKIFILDDDLALEWAKELGMSMKAAEEVRGKEEMRPMAYRLVPEPWTRLRERCRDAGKEGKVDNQENKNKMDTNHEETGDIEDDADEINKQIIYAADIRPRNSLYDETHHIVYDCLYNHFNKLHISCGAKFGCDYLLYDGNRKVRHAFAGIRILTAQGGDDRGGKIKFTIPTAYDMHGYVRGLNTAGKLALLATVVTSKSSDDEGDDSHKYRVAVVDLALEKILSAPTHLKKRKIGKVRNDVGENLAK